MAPLKDELERRLQDPLQTPVWYFTSTEAALLREMEKKTLAALCAALGAEDVTRIDGPAPDLGAVIEATGAISLFGDVRMVLLREVVLSSMGDKDAAELAELFAELENAVLVVTVLHKDKKAAGTKKAKQLFDAAAKAGFADDLALPTRRENLAFLRDAAAAVGASFAPGAAEALLERAGEDRPLLHAEVDKLAAMAGYGVIDIQTVERYGAHNIEADVFALVRHITSCDSGAAHALLADLFTLRHEPVAIAAALAGSYVDMLRVREGERQGRSTADVFSEMGYKGNPWRLQKARDNARRYSDAALRRAVFCLAELDIALKSAALADKSVLLEAAVAELICLGARR